ncbi:CU044_2847 family protein [Aerosakkonema funiforme]|uniref:Trypsin-co-occurring domain-containing protein n=2 Tax=Oscillatoriophycideae TaxID=1301283 RepID=A0A926VPC5_9CYAN|nr:CU044_2847 family protein [Aerosakkonema funiforme]MBD2186179.1 hypothetical protein [Aerosakkonema funiforme FACHB-1375]
MNNFIPLEIEGKDDKVYIEVVPLEKAAGIQQRSNKDSAVDKLTEADFRQMIRKAVLPACQTFVDIWQELNQPMKAESAEVEFNLGFTASGSAFIAQASGQASFKIKVSWKFEQSSLPDTWPPGIVENLKKDLQVLESKTREALELYEQSQESAYENNVKQLNLVQQAAFRVKESLNKS